MDIKTLVQNQINDNPILIYMKGSPEAPNCGFSARAVEALSNCHVPYAYVNILENENIRTFLPKYSNWPTFPQLWVQGELIGGCDIILELLNTGELKKILLQAINKK